MLSLVVFLANFRLYSCGYFRKKNNFKYVLYQNICYLFGMLIGLFIFYKYNILWFPSLAAEVLAIIFSCYKGNLIEKDDKMPNPSLKRNS